MTTLIIADLHLNEQEPAITAGFLRFLREQAVHASQLYILGDFFDYWIGDDDPNPLHKTVADALKSLSDSGVKIFFICGNRDFLLGERYARQCGMTLLPDTQVIEAEGHQILILHGDTLCTDDTDYQHYRQRVHTPWIQRLVLWLPLSLRLKIAKKMRAGSQSANQRKSEAIMDVNQNEVMKAFRQYRTRWMIHGHTHRPAVHDVSADGETHFRGVLGAWHSQGSAFKITPDSISLIFFPF